MQDLTLAQLFELTRMTNALERASRADTISLLIQVIRLDRVKQNALDIINSGSAKMDFSKVMDLPLSFQFSLNVMENQFHKETNTVVLKDKLKKAITEVFKKDKLIREGINRLWT